VLLICNYAAWVGNVLVKKKGTISGGVVGFELAQGYRRLVTAIFIWADHQINFYFLIIFI